MLLTVEVDDIWSSTSAASPASAASLHGSNPLSLMFSSFHSTLWDNFPPHLLSYLLSAPLR
jgi:hypothetical protein